MTRLDETQPEKKEKRIDKHKNHPKKNLGNKLNQMMVRKDSDEMEYKPGETDVLDPNDPNYDDNQDEEMAVMPPVETRANRRRFSSFGDEPYKHANGLMMTLSQFQTKCKGIVEDYLVSNDLKEAMVVLTEIAPSHQFEDEFVVVAFKKGTDSVKTNGMKMVEDLTVTYFHNVEVEKRTCLVRGLEKLLCTWEDLALDVPDVSVRLITIIQRLIKEGLLAESFLCKLPESLLIKLVPQYPEYKKILDSMQDFKKAIAKDLNDYFTQPNLTMFVAQLRQLQKPDFHHEFVKKAICVAFDRCSTKDLFTFLREMYENGLELEALQWGSIRVLGVLEDLKLDFPKACEFVVALLVSLVTDDILSAAFLKRCRLLRIGGACGLQVIKEVEYKLPEYTRKILGPQDFKWELKIMILEYFDSGDKTEVGRIIRELDLDEKMAGEVVRKIITFAMERSGIQCAVALDLIEHLVKNEEELSTEAVVEGFRQLREVLDDLKLDVPDAAEMTTSFYNQAKARGLLTAKKV